MQCCSSSMKILGGADDGGKRQPPALVTTHRRRPALLQSEGAVLAASPACSPSPRGGQPGMQGGSSSTETLWRVDCGESGSRHRRSRRTGAGPCCGNPEAQSLRRSQRAVRAHEEDSEGCSAAVAPRRPCEGLTMERSGSRQRRARCTGAGPRCCSPKVQSLRRSLRAVRAHEEDSEGRAAAVAPQRPRVG